MDIVKTQHTDGVTLSLKGRLDSTWAETLTVELEESIRGGAYNLRLDMRDVSFISSAGVRVLVRFYKELERLHGSLSLTRPSDVVRQVLELSGMASLLIQAKPATVQPVPKPSTSTNVQAGGLDLSVFTLPGARPFVCRAVGGHRPLDQASFDAHSMRPLVLNRDRLALGLGALGQTFDDCRNRFGEFAAAAGAVACLPSDSSHTPDYLVQSGSFVPEIRMLYGLTCDGDCSHLVRFETGRAAKPASLRDLVSALFGIAGAKALAFVMLAEASGLIGASLKRSPTLASPMSIFDFPDIRQWLSFSSERAFGRCLAMVVGVALAEPNPLLSPLLRPIGGDPLPVAHAHAAAFSFRPLQKGLIPLEETLLGVFKYEILRGVLHLLYDGRETGGGDSEFTQGAVWMGPIGTVEQEPGNNGVENTLATHGELE